jgi:IS605 OrfB family transposase
LIFPGGPRAIRPLGSTWAWSRLPFFPTERRSTIPDTTVRPRPNSGAPRRKWPPGANAVPAARKAIQQLQRVHAHLRRQRSNFHHQLSHYLVALYGLIAVENLNVQEFAAGILASVQDAGWSGFIAKLRYKAESAGRQLIEVDPHGTSQRCRCGRPNPQTISKRWHRCEYGLSVSRDHASALVILSMARTEPSKLNVGAVRPRVLRSPRL